MRYALRRLIKRMFRTYTVTAYADDGWTAEHWAWTREEALEWMSAYPTWADIAVHNYKGQLVATRYEG